MLKKWTCLALIIGLATFLRLYKISSVPPSLDWDEAAIGWNAKSILYTHLDEYGTKFPLSFRSFGDYKAPVYIYLTIPFMKIFGTTELSVRLLSILAGIASVGIIYFLVRELLVNTKTLSKGVKTKTALLASLLLAITPWHLLLSRPAFEPNLALFFILLGVWFFLLGVNKKPFYFALCSLLFVLSLYTYHSPKIFVPVFLLGLIFIYRQKLFDKKKVFWLLAAFIIGILALLPLGNSMLFAQGSSRLQGTSLFFSKEGKLKTFDLNLVKQLGYNYLAHYSPKFLFLDDKANPRIQMREVGPLLLIEAPFLLWGLYVLFSKRKEPWQKFLIWWFLVGPIAAVIGIEVPHQIRALNMLPALTIIVALGTVQAIGGGNKLLKIALFTLALSVNAFYFFYHYFISYPLYTAPDWQYGYKEVAKVARAYEGEVDKIIITSTYGQPHIFTYFYQNRDPQGVLWGEMIKYLYRDLKWNEDQDLKNVLLIGTPQEIPAEAKGIINEIKFPDGTVAFRIVKT